MKTLYDKSSGARQLTHDCSETRAPHTQGRSARWAWIAVVLAPVGLLADTALGFLSGAGGGNGQQVVGVVFALLALAFPTLAVYLAVGAVGRGHASGRAAVAVSGLEILLVIGLTGGLH